MLVPTTLRRYYVDDPHCYPILRYQYCVATPLPGDVTLFREALDEIPIRFIQLLLSCPDYQRSKHKHMAISKYNLILNQ
jgi:hypothetical protein